MSNKNKEYYPPQNNQVIGQIPDQMPNMPIEDYGEYNTDNAVQMARDIVTNVKNVENAYDAKKMERMVKGMSIDQQTAMARQFNHYALLDGLRYQLEHLDELESDINNAFAKLAISREE